MCPYKKQNFYKSLYINQISQTSFKSFSNQPSDTASILSSLNSSLPFFLFAFLPFYMKHNFMLRILFKSHLIRHSGTEHGFKDSQDTRALRHSESTQRALGGHLGTRTLGGYSSTWRALGHLRHLDTRTLRALRDLDTQTPGHLEHLGTWTLGHSRHSGTRGTLFSRLLTCLETKRHNSYSSSRSGSSKNLNNEKGKLPH